MDWNLLISAFWVLTGALLVAALGYGYLNYWVYPRMFRRELSNPHRGLMLIRLRQESFRKFFLAFRALSFCLIIAPVVWASQCPERPTYQVDSGRQYHDTYVATAVYTIERSY